MKQQTQSIGSERSDSDMSDTTITPSVNDSFTTVEPNEQDRINAATKAKEILEARKAESKTVFKVGDKPPDRTTPRAPINSNVDTKASATTTKPAPKSNVTSINTIDLLKNNRKSDWAKYIYKDLNPLLFSGVKSFCDIPDGWEDQVVAEFQTPAQQKAGKGETTKLWEPSLRTRLTFSEKDSEKLADAAARFSVSPMGIAITAWLEANAGMIALGIACWIAGKYGFNVMKTKAEIAQFKEALQQQQNMMSQESNGAVPDAA